tara:strand:+ start:578 stop:871 length:294 start_codon:yes stop_codon:yes gene_type:complete
MKNNTLVFKISDKNDFSKLNESQKVTNFIADLSELKNGMHEILINNFTKFEKYVADNNGSFVIVSNINFDDNLNIVPTLQEAYDFVDMEEMERQLNI